MSYCPESEDRKKNLAVPEKKYPLKKFWTGMK